MRDNWKALAIALISIIGTLAGFWVVMGREMTTRSEVTEMIRTQAIQKEEVSSMLINETPYTKDRLHIMSSIQESKQVNVKLTDAINGLTRELAQIRAVNELLLDKKSQ